MKETAIPESILLELLKQTTYIDDLKVFTSIVVDDISEHALENVNSALAAALIQIDGALRLDTANDIEYEDTFEANIIVILDSLASRIGEIQHRMAVFTQHINL